MQEIDSVNYLSKRVAGLKPSGIRKFFDIAATMKDVISPGNAETYRGQASRCGPEDP